MENNGNKAKVWKNLFFSVLAQIITIALGLIIPRITIVGYGSSVNGLLTSVSQIVAYLILFEAGIRAVAQQSLYKTLSTGDSLATNQVLSAVNKNYKRIGILYLTGLIILSILYPLFVEVEGLGYFSVAIIVLLSGLGNVVSFFITGKYSMLIESDGRAYIITNLNTTISIATHIAKIILIYLGFPVVVVCFVTFVIHMIQNVYIFKYVKSKYHWVDLSVSPNLKSLEQSSHALIHQISTLIFRNTDVLLLTIFCDLKIVSVYSMYKLILGYLGNFLLLPLNSCNFAMGQLFNRNVEEYKKITSSLEINFNILIFSVLSVAQVLILPFLSVYTAGISDVNYVDKYIAILFVATELLDLIRMPCLRTINYAKHYKKTMSRSIFESVINLSVSIFGVIYFGIYGVLIGTVIALLYRTIDIIFYANKKVLEHSPLKSLLSVLVNWTLLAGVYFVYPLLNINISNFFDFITVGIIITPIVMLTYFSVNYLLFRKDMLHMLSILKINKKFKV